MEAVSLHEPLQVFPCQVSVAVDIARGEGVMDVEGRLTGALLLGDLNFLVGVEVNFEALEEDLASLISKVVPLGDFFLMNVLGLAIAKLVLIIAILRSKSLAEVAILQLRVVVLVVATREVVHIVLVSMHAHLIQEGEDLRG